MLHVLAPGPTGGLERVVQMLATAQADRAHVATVITPEDQPNHPYVADLTQRGVQVAEIVVGGRAYRDEYRAISSLIGRTGATVVHTHGYRSDMIAGLAGRSAGVPVVSTVHGFTGGGFRDRMYERVQGFALRRMHAVVAVSRPLVARLVGMGVPAERIHLVPNAYSPSAPLRDRRAARSELGLKDDGLVAGWVGRLSHEKGPDLMLRALPHADPRWRLSIVGDGRERTALVALAASLGVADRVTWHGAVPNAGALLAAFDALVLSSRTEGTPIILLEAMAAGVPIVANAVGGVPDIVRESDGLLVRAESAHAIEHASPLGIAVALARVAAEPEAAALRARTARARVEGEYAVDAWVGALENVYAAALRE